MTATVLTAIESAIEPSECSNGTEDVLALETEDCSEKNHLLTSFTDTTFQYTQIDRVGNIAFFTQTHKKSGIVRYEVVVIDIQPVHTFPNGITTPDHEAYPSSSQWGSKGWTMYTEAGAREKIRWLQHPSTEERTDRVERQEWQRLHPERYVRDPVIGRLREKDR